MLSIWTNLKHCRLVKSSETSSNNFYSPPSILLAGKYTSTGAEYVGQWTAVKLYFTSGPELKILIERRVY